MATKLTDIGRDFERVREERNFYKKYSEELETRLIKLIRIFGRDLPQDTVGYMAIENAKNLLKEKKV